MRRAARTTWWIFTRCTCAPRSLRQATPSRHCSMPTLRRSARCCGCLSSAHLFWEAVSPFGNLHCRVFAIGVWDLSPCHLPLPRCVLRFAHSAVLYNDIITCELDSHYLSASFSGGFLDFCTRHESGNQVLEGARLVCRKAGDARAVLVSETYQEALKAAVLDGRLDAAVSPAAVLNELITQVSMPGEQVLCFSLQYFSPMLLASAPRICSVGRRRACTHSHRGRS